MSDDQDMAEAITRDPETMHGVPVFRGTRVPVQTLLDNPEGDDTLEDFLAGFPTVPRALALEALEEARELLLGRGRSVRTAITLFPAHSQRSDSPGTLPTGCYVENLEPLSGKTRP